MRFAGLADRIIQGDRRALARGISLVQDDHADGRRLIQELYPTTGSASIVGLTGPPGAGKSTLVNSLVTRKRHDGHAVSVLAIDPSSPFGGGAVLGDRVRMSEHVGDAGVYIRSMASRGAVGGTSDSALQVTMLMDAAGFETVFVETVGVGQTEISISRLADCIVLVLLPGSGDSIQALKAGVMEIPDIVVVNKADLPGAKAMLREVRSTLALGPKRDRRIQVIATSSTTGEGIVELDAAIREHDEYSKASGERDRRRTAGLTSEIIALAASRVQRDLETHMSSDPKFSVLAQQVVSRRLDPATASELVLERWTTR